MKCSYHNPAGRNIRNALLIHVIYENVDTSQDVLADCRLWVALESRHDE
jgi:hypothetical protein